MTEIHKNPMTAELHRFRPNVTAKEPLPGSAWRSFVDPSLFAAPPSGLRPHLP
ncbi:hypothetical protein SAMN04488058_1332 [Deinococcus reticulitermitis]|uniref:Uncharacterized protein n=1 Tax=Deinococcus reticulitermitis TaxID=856736 RepID=A0A1H7CLK1_9DEIO|nr:hypothetical protein [Deinococcus reticulitermitis]SEJ90529.1 hypothetical protein SAMN04488058_1332 [Deinococcus reticulitermitis]